MESIFTLSKTWDEDAKFAKGVSLNPRKSICNSEYQALQIHQLSKKHLRQQINPGYRYIRHQKSKSFITLSISITIHHKARKRLCNPANWSRACPTKLSRSAQSFFAWGCRELNSKKFTVMTETVLQSIGENVSESIYKR